MAFDCIPNQVASARAIARLAAPYAAKAALLALLRLKGGALAVTLPGGGVLVFGDKGPGCADLRIKDYGFAARVLKNGDIGFAEGWIAGEWESEDLTALLTLLADNVEQMARMFEGAIFAKALNWIRHRQRQNSKDGARRNILAHYDLGNAFYAAWLDATMTYSAALYGPPHEPLAGPPDEAPGEALGEVRGKGLEDAQRAKYRAIAEQLELKRGEHVLEIGCGWGGFAEFAAREFGVRVTGVTISDAQYRYARDRIEAAGLSGEVDIRRQDYRDIEGQFDKIASIEMFEAVGEAYWPAYFSKIAEVLKPGGRVCLQIITIKSSLFEKYRKRADFIQRYVFPGGMLASVERLREETSSAGLVWRNLDAFGAHYARTLEEWAKRFSNRWQDIREMGFDERFKRLWLFYFGYCAAGFRSGRTDVVQLALSKPGSERPCGAGP